MAVDPPRRRRERKRRPGRQLMRVEFIPRRKPHEMRAKPQMRRRGDMRAAGGAGGGRILGGAVERAFEAAAPAARNAGAQMGESAQPFGFDDAARPWIGEA